MPTTNLDKLAAALLPNLDLQRESVYKQFQQDLSPEVFAVLKPQIDQLLNYNRQYEIMKECVKDLFTPTEIRHILAMTRTRGWEILRNKRSEIEARKADRDKDLLINLINSGVQESLDEPNKAA